MNKREKIKNENFYNLNTDNVTIISGEEYERNIKDTIESIESMVAIQEEQMVIMKRVLEKLKKEI